MVLLTLCGSLRARSSNRAILQAYTRLAPAEITIEHYEGLASLPAFNPDDDGPQVPASVTELRRRVAGAAAVVISTPEYAHALPGAFKNALDWLVSDPAFDGKPIVILQAARGSTWALDSLTEVLRTMSARVISAAGVQLPLGTNAIDEEAILANPTLRALLAGSWKMLRSELERTDGGTWREGSAPSSMPESLDSPQAGGS